MQRVNELYVGDEVRNGKQVCVMEHINGRVRYVDRAKFLEWESSILLPALRKERERLDALPEETGAFLKISVLIGKRKRYFDTREEAHTALNVFNAQNGLPLHTLR